MSEEFLQKVSMISWKKSTNRRRAIWKNFGVVDELFEKIPVSEDELFEKIPVSEDELFEKITVS